MDWRYAKKAAFADGGLRETDGHLSFLGGLKATTILQDLKTGNMGLDIREARQAKTPLSEEQKQALKGKEKSIPNALEAGKWHDLLVTVEGDTLSVSLNGQTIGSHRSPGIAHPTKRLLRLAVPHNAVVDDVKIYRKK